MIAALAPLVKERAGRERQEAFGQFLTPPPVGDFMASLFNRLPDNVRLLDAGAGAGALTAAFVRRACKQPGVKTIHATAYEIDSAILPALRETMARCESVCGANGINFTASINHADFVQEMAEKLAGSLWVSAAPSFNVAIANPPYKKINTDSAERFAFRSVGLETSNLYAGFIALISRLLDTGGQIVAITPRSFCNGPYFRPFRESFLSMMELRRLHVFESRQAAFRDDAVLQENIIFHAVKGNAQPETIIISSSSGETDNAVTAKILPFEEIVHSGDPAKFIHIPADAEHASAKAKLAELPATLASLGLSVSTGRVVDFRLRDALRPMPTLGTVPLLYPCHFNGGTMRWPKAEAKKANAILDNEETRPWLVPSGLYVLTKRFTSKEERRRLVACIFEPAEIEAEWLGFENHLNYFHANGRGLEKHLARGLYAYLNSTVVDQYFRCFSGHTQVNATDLRSLAYPDRATLEAIGTEMKRLDLTQAAIDDLIEKYVYACKKAKQQSCQQKASSH